MAEKKLNLGNLVTPNGASLIFGAKVEEDGLDLSAPNAHTWEPYTIIIEEEDEGELIPADAILYDPPADSPITSTNLQTVISELVTLMGQVTPTLSSEVFTLSENASTCTYTKDFATNSIMIFYNGLMLNAGVHYTIANKVISLLDFTAEADDIITIVGFAAASPNNILNLIGGSY